MPNINTNIIFKDQVFYPMLSPVWNEQKPSSMNTTLMGIYEKFQPNLSLDQLKLFKGEHRNAHHYIQAVSDRYQDKITNSFVGHLYFFYELLLPKKEQVDVLLQDDTHLRMKDWWRQTEEVYKTFGLVGRLHKLAKIDFYSVTTGNKQPKQEFVIDFAMDRFMNSLITVLIQCYPDIETCLGTILNHVVNATYIEWDESSYKFLQGYESGPLTFMQKLEFLSKDGAASPYYYAPYVAGIDASEKSHDWLTYLFMEHFLAEVCLEIMKIEFGRSEVAKAILSA